MNKDKKIVIFDLDGTLALIDKRRALATKDGKMDWDVFFDRDNIKLDVPNTPVIKMAQMLKSQGFDIVILDCKKNDSEKNLKNIQIIRADISDENEINSIKVKDIDAVLHLAGQSSGPKSFSIPITDIRLNLIGTTNMINFCENNKSRRFQVPVIEKSLMKLT